MAIEAARAAAEALWAAMVELAEAGNDLAVRAQAGAMANEADRIAAIATDLAVLASAAAVAARHSADGGPA